MDISEVELALDQAIEAAERLGVHTADARSAATTIRQRRGYPSDLYVLVLAGGTGVGKSSLLNALAGREVSPAGTRRPTTTAPVALLPAECLEEARALLEWLGGAEVRIGAASDQAVAIVDLPDLDSIEPAHAARVDMVLPRADAVLWVTDPEKYDDALLHERYLRRWVPRLAYQAAVVNKIDRLSPVDGARIGEDLQGRLAQAGLPPVPVLLVSAIHDIDPLRGWLARGAGAKEIVRARLRQAAKDAAHALAVAAGVDGPAPPRRLAADAARADTVSASREATIDLIGPDGLHARATAAVRASTRSLSADPVGLLRSVTMRTAANPDRGDPVGYLRRWRERGSLDRSIAPIRRLLVSVSAELPPAARPSVLGAADPADIGQRLARGVDGVIAPTAARPLPHDRLWPLIDMGRLAAGAAFLFGAIWLGALFLTGASTPTSAVELPILGPMPMPAALCIAGSLLWLILGRVLRWRAGRLARRWADGVLEAISRGVDEVIADTLGRSLGSVDASRLALWEATQSIERAEPEADSALVRSSDEAAVRHAR